MARFASSSFSPQRRKVLLGGGVLLFSGLFVRAWQLTRSQHDHELARLIVSVFPHEADSLAMGEAFAKSHPQWTMDFLIETLTAHWPLLEPNLAETRRLLQRKIRDDFENSRLEEYEGWLFATTEAQIMTLGSLLKHADG